MLKRVQLVCMESLACPLKRTISIQDRQLHTNSTYGYLNLG